MNWGNSETNKGVTERDFTVSCNGRTVPGVLWTPEAAKTPTPLVLIGHGGSGHKRETHLVALARRFVRHNANPGLHSAVPRDEFLYTQAFLARHLTGTSGRS